MLKFAGVYSENNGSDSGSRSLSESSLSGESS